MSRRPADAPLPVEALLTPGRQARNVTFPVVYFTNSSFMGGMEAHILQLARGFSTQGRRIGLVCDPNGDIEPLKAACLAAGIAVHEVSPGSRSHPAARFLALRRVLKLYRGGLLHVHMTGPHGGDLVMLAAKAAGIRAIVRTEHQPLEARPARQLLRRMKLRDRLLDRVICVSRENLLYFTRDLGRDAAKFTAIPNCVDTERFAPRECLRERYRRELGFTEGSMVIGMVSRLGEARKGGAQFLGMAAAVAERFPEARFLIVGDGELLPALQQQAEQRALTGRASFTGARTDVEGLLSAMDVFVMPSLWEGGPITVLEAMALEKAVVATDVGMVSEAITAGVDGVIVPPGDVAGLTAAVCRLLTDSSVMVEMGQRAREKVLQGFSPAAMLERTLGEYELAMSQG